MRYKILLTLILVVFLIGCSNNITKADYEGTWNRQGTYTNGQLVSSEPAKMILTKNTFDSSNKYCSNSGDVELKGKQLIMKVTKSNCPSIISVGSVVKSTYEVSSTKLSLINTEYGASVKEIYSRSS